MMEINEKRAYLSSLAAAAPGEVTFSGPEEAQLFTLEVKESLQGVLEKSFLHSQGKPEEDFVTTSVDGRVCSDHFWSRDGFGEFMDQGIQYFSYMLMPHCSSWQQSGIVRRAQELLNPAIAVLETFHKGSLPLRDSYISIDQTGIIVTVLKQAEDGGALVLRCCETLGKMTIASIDLMLAGVAWVATFGPYEIKTFRISQSSVIEETNLLEGELP